jgi:hypothetical protein
MTDSFRVRQHGAPLCPDQLEPAFHGAHAAIEFLGDLPDGIPVHFHEGDRSELIVAEAIEQSLALLGDLGCKSIASGSPFFNPRSSRAGPSLSSVSFSIHIAYSGD